MAMEIFTVGRGQEGYPERLMPFADMPSRLFVRGALPADEQKTAAIVGARICTAYGKSQAAFFAQVLAANGVAVISGLACGTRQPRRYSSPTVFPSKRSAPCSDTRA